MSIGHRCPHSSVVIVKKANIVVTVHIMVKTFREKTDEFAVHKHKGP
jgi:hypothetical protein